MVFKLAWGAEGAKAAVENGDVVVIIDALRFTSAAVTAVANGFSVIPAKNEEEARLLSSKHHAVLGKTGICALSPRQFLDAQPTRIVLASPHGATVCCEATGAKNAFLGSFLNAEAVAQAVAQAAAESGRDATIVASGEIGAERRACMPRFEAELAGGNGIFCFEDYACAGCISAKIRGEKMKELLAAEEVFREKEERLTDCMRECASGKYLSEKGFDADVDFCARINRFKCVPEIAREMGDAIIVGDE